MKRQTTAASVVESLATHGVDTVHGVPGVHNDPPIDALYAARGRAGMLHALHEQAGADVALGAKACPDRAVLSIAGDGGFAYQAVVLAMAALHNLAVVVVVFDDGASGNVRRIQREAYGDRQIASGLHNPDFGRFAESFGVAAFRAHTAANLEARLREAFALNAPAPVRVPVGEMPSTWDLIAMPPVRGKPARPAMP